MQSHNEYILEEILLGYLRGSKKIKLANIEEIPVDNGGSTISISLDVDANFGKTLIKPLDSKSNNFFKLDQKNEY